ncbi:Desumoylating isopeptidase 1 [Lachnellula arida]|uniref:Desumoylating isopeptidase 1 n=2 Tax=Lachnellula TaxID=47830 RepID=A0A8T9BKJ7_9HELO|nr:Desumoylating isopeptidase 1 [Lachnellula arida]TVY92270.1 Desumoylating isopeptidase [Lachnellula willkommii]
MDIQLYVYDLSQGLASQLSFILLGTYIDAIYHTSIVMGGIEYTYDGGIKTTKPANTALGKPKNIIDLGKTELPMEVIMEYLESLKEVYTFEAYDLWSHNCNNFTNDFATFLLGKGIPDYITNIPQKVLDTDFGRALKPQIDQMVKRNHEKRNGFLGIGEAITAPKTHEKLVASVRRPTTVAELDKVLLEARKSCVVVFFSSAECAPCKKLYPLYDQLAAEYAHKAVLIRVDLARSFDISTKYQIRSTPSFITFLHGAEENRWSSSASSTLIQNIQLLVQMAWPPHSHESLSLPALHALNTRPVLFGKVPPLGKLKTKMGPAAEDRAVSGVLNFVAARASEGAAEATLPDLNAFRTFLRSASSKLPIEVMFTIVDLLRVALVDPRFSGWFAEEHNHTTIELLLSSINTLKDCPYSLRLVALQMACNLFSTPLYPPHILECPALRAPIVQLITTSLLDDKHHNVRVAAASLSFNIASANCKIRADEHREALPEGDQIELAASLLEAIQVEEASPEALKGFLLAFGYLIYCAPKNGELVDLLKSMDAQGTILSKTKIFPDEQLIRDIGEELLGKGLR